MPTLPSGLYLAIDRQHIMEPDRNWFRAPDNHFWYWSPAPENPPPFKPTDMWEAIPQNAPIPSSREEMSQFIHVVIGLPDGKLFWQGDFLSDFPFFMNLDEADLNAWRQWVASEPVQKFLDDAIIQCKMQAEINKEATGWAVMQSHEPDEHGINAHKVIDNPLRHKQ